MPKRTDIKKVMIIGSGPIIIGQACEFDYSGTQACKALKKLGYEIVLVNSNPATIMTDPETADVTYIEPLNKERLEQIIAKERPDALLPNLGGQSGLNLCAELAGAGILEKYQVKATFLLTGREDEESLRLYQEIHKRGHTVGMHSYTHKYHEIYASTEAFEQDLEQIQGRIFETLGFTCSLYRFPGGSSNQVSELDMQEFIRVLNDRKITYFDWNAECGDASSQSYKVKELVDNVMKDVVKYHTSVVLLHDADNKRNTVKALPKMIERLLDMDAQILPIEEDTTLVQHVSAKSVED